MRWRISSSSWAVLKIIAADDKLREDIGSLGGIATVLDLYEKSMDCQAYLLEAVALVIRLTCVHSAAMRGRQRVGIMRLGPRPPCLMCWRGCLSVFLFSPV